MTAPGTSPSSALRTILRATQNQRTLEQMLNFPAFPYDSGGDPTTPPIKRSPAGGERPAPTPRAGAALRADPSSYAQTAAAQAGTTMPAQLSDKLPALIGGL